MTTKITLTNPNDGELNAAVAEHVAKLPVRDDARISARPGAKVICHSEEYGVCSEMPPYATSADAVLPLLEKYDAWSKGTTGGAVTVYKQTLSPAQKPSDDIPDNEWMILKPVGHYWNCDNPKPFPYSACIALLRANGVEVVFT